MLSHDPQHTRPVWAEISSEHLRNNYRQLRTAAGPAIHVLAVVKANAYGHGATGCAPVLAAAGAPWLGVTGVQEGIAVRRSLSILPQTILPRILVMCGLWPGEAEASLHHNLTPVVWEHYQLDLLQAAAHNLHLPAHSVPVHLEIDTGMARQGVAPGPALAAFLHQLGNTPALHLEAVLTHFASAECVDSPQNQTQANLFRSALQQIAAAGLHPAILHAGNTSGLDTGFCAPRLHAWAQQFSATDPARAQPGPHPAVTTHAMTRAGLALYGHALPLENIEGTSAPASILHSLQPVLTWKTRILSLRTLPTGATIGYDAAYRTTRPTRLALLPVGYADGLRRALSSTSERPGGAALVHGHRAPILGRVSMDLTTIDVTGIPNAAIGDEVILLGQQGGQTISAQQHASLAHTTVYEILCGIHDRVPRILLP